MTSEASAAPFPLDAGNEPEAPPSRVVPLHDGIVPLGEVYGPVIEKIEDLLARARRGEVVGLIYATVNGNGEGGHGWEVAHGPRLAIAGALLAVMHRYGESLAES